MNKPISVGGGTVLPETLDNFVFNAFATGAVGSTACIFLGTLPWHDIVPDDGPPYVNDDTVEETELPGPWPHVREYELPYWIASDPVADDFDLGGA